MQGVVVCVCVCKASEVENIERTNRAQPQYTLTPNGPDSLSASTRSCTLFKYRDSIACFSSVVRTGLSPCVWSTLLPVLLPVPLATLRRAVAADEPLSLLPLVACRFLSFGRTSELLLDAEDDARSRCSCRDCCCWCSWEVSGMR